ncbi:MAG: thrombospondin type 3 repeat-containing protein [Pseudomonadota bacterium]
MHNSATFKPSAQTWVKGLFVVLLGLAPMVSAVAAELYGMAPARIEQNRGVDQTVNYAGLGKYGVWDDRNYELTSDDLKYLSPNEHEVSALIPAFFRVELRKAWPHLQTKGSAQYPRAAWPMFRKKYGGIMRDGKLHGPDFNQNRVVPVNGELRISQIRAANEPTIEINRAQPQYAIAGANNGGGQEMYYSHDGGDTWTVQGVLPNTCCDPTVDWSSDGNIGYTAALSGPIGVSFWRTDDFGVTWTNRVDLTASGSDKEWIHVDKSPSSPYQDNVYVTYHNGNVMQFARTEDLGLTFDITSFNGAPTGIGSDITTTSNGDVYYVWGSTGTSTIQLLKSTDGGDTFAAPQTITATNGNFDFPIPAMESRRAWIYATADADTSGGPLDGSVYVAFTDTTGPESPTAALNHTQVKLYYSRDGGATWNFTIPHATADANDVDRFNQWMTVDEQGNVHVVFYDTRNSVNRTGVDLYYNISTDGGLTWDTPTRVSGETSINVTTGQEWGDYNGVSVVGDKVIPIWSDNRPTDGGTASQIDTFVADVLNVGAGPNFQLTADSSTFEVCVPDTVGVNLNVGSISGFSDDVTLSSSAPAGFGVTFGTNPVSPGGSSSATISVGGTVTGGDYNVDLIGSATGVDDRVVGVSIAAADAVPGSATLVSPANGEGSQALMPTLTWNDASQAASYQVQIATDPGFTNLVDLGVTDTTSYTLAATLETSTTYYWRVRAINICGDGAYSAANSFETGTLICTSPNVAIPDNSAAGVDSSLTVPSGGALTDLNVSLMATHTYVGDLIFTLTHDDTGTSVIMVDRPGVPASGFGCGNNNVDATIDDESGTPVETTCLTDPALAGVLSPNNPLSAFDGEDLSGSWTLNVSDNAGIDTGTMDTWCLIPAIEDVAVDTDGDGVSDDVDNCSLVSNPDQRDTNGDGFGNICDPDLDNNGVVNFLDVNAWTPTFNTSCGDVDEDFNGDGVCNFADYVLFSQFFLQPPGPGATE